MLKKIGRKIFLEKYPNITHGNAYRDKFVVPEVYDSYILYANSGSTTGLCSGVSTGLTKLMQLLCYDRVYFLGDTTTPWLFRDHDYTPVNRGLTYLANNKISKSFNGAIEVDIQSLTQFMKHLFWLVRCNGIVTYVQFIDPGFNIMGSICQYGNIHFSTVNEEVDEAFNNELPQTGLHILEGNNCGGERIYGRKATFYD
jgi:hypothetical protein